MLGISRAPQDVGSTKETLKFLTEILSDEQALNIKTVANNNFFINNLRMTGYNIRISFFSGFDIMFFSSLLNLMFPPCCPVCGKPTAQAGALCPDCYAGLKFCPASEKRRASAVLYGDVSKDVVLKLKYADAPELADMMGGMMVRAGGPVLDGADVLVPVPLHPVRLFSRKYNQAALLGQAVSKKTGIPCDPFVLKRIKKTAKQDTREQRFKNVKKAFAAVPSHSVSGKTVVVVDDVVTTGATFFSCAATLMAAGAREVRLLTFAKAVGGGQTRP